MIRQASAGIYSWLPLGYRVLRNIERIVHEEQERAGHIPMLMPTLQSADLWRESGRYDDYGKEMLRITDRHGRDMLYGPTNEELITDIFRSYVGSYRDLPLTLYHIQWKFRDEVRPRFGVMRGREFLMKDGYNFDLTQEAALHAYNRHMVSYLRTYERMGLQAIPMRADSGPIGGEDTHEFLVLADTGELEVFYDAAVTDLRFGERAIDYDDVAQCQGICEEFTTLYARTDETHDAATFDEMVPEERQRTARGIEVGQIFYFGTKYSEPMGATVDDGQGGRVPVHMGSHGIGVSRLVGAIIEASHDDKRHHLARGGDAVPCRDRQCPAGRCGDRCGLCGARGGVCGAGPRAALRRPRGARRGEVRHDGPDRPALADHRWAAGAGERRGRGHVAPHRRERGDEPGGRRRPDRRSDTGGDAAGPRCSGALAKGRQVSRLGCSPAIGGAGPDGRWVRGVPR